MYKAKSLTGEWVTGELENTIEDGEHKAFIVKATGQWVEVLINTVRIEENDND